MNFSSRSHFILLLILLLITINDSESRRAPKGVSKDNKKPSTMDATAYCVACKEIIIESLEILKKSKSELKIFDTLNVICNNEKIV